MTRPCSCAVGNMLSATGDTLAPLVTLDKTSQLGPTTVTRSNESNNLMISHQFGTSELRDFGASRRKSGNHSATAMN